MLDPSKIKVIFFDIMKTLIDPSSCPREEMAEYVRVFCADPWEPVVVPEAWFTLHAFPDAVEGVRRLQAADFRCVALSNVPSYAVEVMTENAGLWMDAVPLEEERVYKPKQRAYDFAAQWCEVLPMDCLMVTANPKLGGHQFGDVEAARSVGMQAQLVRNPGCPQTIIELAELLGA